MQYLSLLGLGLVLGLQHALDFDHLSAVSMLVSQTKNIKKSSFLGLLWGAGHTITLFIVGSIVLVFKLSIPDKIALSFEFLIGVLLIILGANVLLKIKKEKIHIHIQGHKSSEHIHLHSHLDKKAHKHSYTSFFIGMFHGLAGSAALMLLVLATASPVAEGLSFVFIFGVGLTIGMIAMSSLMSLPFLFAKKFPSIDVGIKLLTSFLGLLIGTSIAYNSGTILAHGLF